MGGVLKEVEIYYYIITIVVRVDDKFDELPVIFREHVKKYFRHKTILGIECFYSTYLDVRGTERHHSLGLHKIEDEEILKWLDIYLQDREQTNVSRIYETFDYKYQDVKYFP